MCWLLLCDCYLFWLCSLICNLDSALAWFAYFVCYLGGVLFGLIFVVSCTLVILRLPLFVVFWLRASFVVYVMLFVVLRMLFILVFSVSLLYCLSGSLICFLVGCFLIVFPCLFGVIRIFGWVCCMLLYACILFEFGLVVLFGWVCFGGWISV